MKKILNNISLPAFIILFVFAGCSKDFTDKKPNDAIAISTALSTEANLANAMNGVYSEMRAVGVYGRDFPVIGDLMADNSFIETKNSNRYLTQYNYTFIAADGVFDGIWKNCYTTIMRANQIINADITGGNVKAIKAQAYGVRGLMYFKLVNLYARPYTDDPNSLGVPIVLTYDPYNLPTRSKVGDVYTQIISDLKAGFADGPAYTKSVTLSKYAIEGLLARVYLYMGDNTNAKSAAVDVITNGGFTLLTPSDFNNYWSDPSGRQDKLETLFEIDADVVNNNGFNDLGGIYENGYQDIYASSQLDSLFDSTDVRNSLFIQGNTKSGASAVLVNKYPNAANDNRDNIKVMRLSEVYLIAAEASLPANEPDAKMYVNDLVVQRDPTSAGYTSSGAALLSDIVQERRKELAFEGDRFFDLNRLKQTITRVQNLGSIQTGPGNVNLVVPYTDYRRIAPIPQSEIQANSNIASQQNPGY